MKIFLLITVLVCVFQLGWWLGRRMQIRTWARYWVNHTACFQHSRYAYYTLKAHNFMARVPLVGKFAIGAMASFWYAQILKEGINYDRQTKVS